MNKHSLIYLPVSVEENGVPDDGYYFITAKNKHVGGIETACEVCDGDFYMIEDKGYPSDKNKVLNWLKPINDVYVFSSEDLKKLLGDAFEAGELFDHYEKFLELKSNEHGVPNKETYLNNLTI